MNSAAIRKPLQSTLSTPEIPRRRPGPGSLPPDTQSQLTTRALGKCPPEHRHQLPDPRAADLLSIPGSPRADSLQRRHARKRHGRHQLSKPTVSGKHSGDKGHGKHTVLRHERSSSSPCPGAWRQPRSVPGRSHYLRIPKRSPGPPSCHHGRAAAVLRSTTVFDRAAFFFDPLADEIV
jgi:hypothetical protein